MTTINVQLKYSPTDPPLWIAETDQDKKLWTAGTNMSGALHEMGRMLDAFVPTPNDPDVPMRLPVDGAPKPLSPLNPE